MGRRGRREREELLDRIEQLEVKVEQDHTAHLKEVKIMNHRINEGLERKAALQPGAERRLSGVEDSTERILMDLRAFGAKLEELWKARG